MGPAGLCRHIHQHPHGRRAGRAGHKVFRLVHGIGRQGTQSCSRHSIALHADAGQGRNRGFQHGEHVEQRSEFRVYKVSRIHRAVGLSL